MVARRNAKEKDSNIWFCTDRSAGILIQPQLRKCIYFIKGSNIDTLYYDKDAPASEVDQWVGRKRKHYMSLPK